MVSCGFVAPTRHCRAQTVNLAVSISTNQVRARAVQKWRGYLFMRIGKIELLQSRLTFVPYLRASKTNSYATSSSTCALAISRSGTAVSEDLQTATTISPDC